MAGRFHFIRFLIWCVFGVIFVRLFVIMIVQHNHYKVLAYRQHVVETKLSANRGEIFTSDGYPLVVNTDAYLMFAVPSENFDKNALVQSVASEIVKRVDLIALDPELEDRYKKIERRINPNSTPTPSPSPSVSTTDPNQLLPVYRNLTLPVTLHYLRYLYIPYENEPDWKQMLRTDLEYVLPKLLSDDKNYFVQLINQLDYDDEEALEKNDWKGIHFTPQNKRTYPEKDMAAHLLGIVGKDEKGEDKGYFGLEGYYNGDLSGQSGYAVTEQDIEGKMIPIGLQMTNKPLHGRDLILTIDRELQYMLEKKISESVKKFGAKNGTGIILDPHSGAILAMANAPSYNPEYWTEELWGEGDVSKVDVFRNYAIAANYEPGSIMKPVTMSMALNESLVTPLTIFHDTGPVTYSGYQVRTWNNKYSGDISMMQILQLSNNTGAAWVGHQVGFNRFADYLTKFNLGQSTGIDLQGEESGIVRDAREWRDIDLANMSFGQGISVTPIQMTAIFGALVNGGILYQPYVVKELVDHLPDGDKVIKKDPAVLGRTISPETSEKIRYMLRSVVTDGEFKWFVQKAGMDHYSIGGKTGTAQIPVNGQYDPNKTNTTFVGFSSVDDPKFVMLIRFSQPSSSTYSADTAVPAWMEAAKELMVRFQIQPE
ncbi:penicillin-binding protein 2 [candidate division WWE3 bacterium]|nr:penicillin-binding protein 2 [candidate division WWE3 bacterium]